MVSPTGSGATGSIHTRGTERTLNTSSSAARTTREARRAPEVSRAPLTAEVGGARPTRAVLPEAERDGLADAFARRVADVSIVACMVQIGTRVPGVVWRTGTRRVRLFLVSRNCITTAGQRVPLRMLPLDEHDCRHLNFLLKYITRLRSRTACVAADRARPVLPRPLLLQSPLLLPRLSPPVAVQTWSKDPPTSHPYPPRGAPTGPPPWTS